MTKDELLAELRELSNDDDARNPEYDHRSADDLLLKYIDDQDVREAFLAITRWYA